MHFINTFVKASIKYFRVEENHLIEYLKKVNFVKKKRLLFSKEMIKTACHFKCFVCIY